MTQSSDPNGLTRSAETALSPLFLQRWSPRAFTDETLGEAELLRLDRKSVV